MRVPAGDFVSNACRCIHGVGTLSTCKQPSTTTTANARLYFSRNNSIVSYFVPAGAGCELRIEPGFLTYPWEFETNRDAVRDCVLRGKPRSGSACRSLMFSVSLLPHSLAALSLPSEVRALCEPDILEASKLSSQLKDIANASASQLSTASFSMKCRRSWRIPIARPFADRTAWPAALRDVAALPRRLSGTFLTGLPPHFADRSRPAVAKAVRELDALMAEVFGTVEQQQQKEAA